MDTHFARYFCVFLLFTALLLSGCASSGGVGKAVNRTLESVGLRETDADAAAGIRTIPLRLYAGDNLNAGNGPRGLATVVRIYYLRGIQRFEQVPFDALMDEGRERAELGNDLIEVRELVLTPGIRRELEERLPAEATHLGVVALFRAPANGRWRYAFDARHRDVQSQGITIGLHACALTTSSEALASAVPGDPGSLVSARCAP
ncbi:type VI secretion system lipoprotein TssJ [Luteimonas sp. A478]